MTNKSSNKVIYFCIYLGLFGCTTLPGNQPQTDTQEIETNMIEQKTISISCEKKNIQDYVIDGWEISSREEKEAICSWKVKKSTPQCNLERDKGCRVLIPDEMGEEVIYYLERIVPIENN